MKIPNKIPEFLFSVRLTPKKSLIAIVIASLMTFLTVRCSIDQNEILKLYNEIRKGIKFNLPDNNIIKEFDNQLNDKIIKDPDLLEFKIKNDISDAIREYEKETGYDSTIKLPSPRYSEAPLDASVCHSEDCRALGGEMRLCAPWYDGCPDNLKSDPKVFSNSLTDDMMNK